MSAKNASTSIGKAFADLKEMEIHDANDLRKYVKTYGSIMSRIQGEMEAAAEEVKLKLISVNPKQVEMSKQRLMIMGRWVASYLGKSADHVKSAQRSAYKAYASFEKHFSDDAIEERKQERLRREEEKRREALNKKK